MKALLRIMAAVTLIASSAVGKTSALDALDARLAKNAAPSVQLPERASFEDFLEKDARVPDQNRPGEYMPYSFAGREAVRLLVRRIDHVLGSHTGQPICDASWYNDGSSQDYEGLSRCNLLNLNEKPIFETCAHFGAEISGSIEAILCGYSSADGEWFGWVE